MRWDLPLTSLTGTGSVTSTVALPIPKQTSPRVGFFPAPAMLMRQGNWDAYGVWNPGGGVVVGASSDLSLIKHGVLTFAAHGGAWGGWNGGNTTQGVSATATFTNIHVETVLITAALQIPSLGRPRSVFLGQGGARCGGTAGNVEALTHTATVVAAGGAVSAGTAAVTSESHVGVWDAVGGSVAGGTAPATFYTRTLTVQAAGGSVCGGTSLAFRATAAGTAWVDGGLPLIESGINVIDTTASAIRAALPKMQAQLSGGMFYVEGKLPSITAELSAYRGVLANIDARLRPSMATLDASSGLDAAASVVADLPTITAVLSGKVGAFSTITAQLPAIKVSINARKGSSGRIDAPLRLIASNLVAGQGGIANIDAPLPTRINSAITTTRWV